MKVFKYIVLLIMLLKLDTFSLVYFGATLGSLLSAAFFGCLLVYFFLAEKQKPFWPLVLLGICYFFISAFNFTGVDQEFITDSIKFFLFSLLIASLVPNTTKLEFAIILLIGGLSILVNAISFPDQYGRYSGFYINPNTAGSVTLIGYVFAFSMKNKKLKLLFQFLLILCGIMTLSRFFILVLVLITLLSMVYSRYNAIGAAIGALVLVVVITSGDFKLNTSRFNALQSIFSDDVDTQTISEETRDETWALYKEPLMNGLLVGNGYKSFQGHEYDTVGVSVGVHNSYLMTLGEAGIIPFLILVSIYITLLIKSAKRFFEKPEYFYLAVVLFGYLMVSHKYYDNYIILFFTIWLYKQLEQQETPKPLTT